VVPLAALDATVDAMADKLASGATWAIRWTKTVANIPLRRLASLAKSTAIPRAPSGGRAASAGLSVRERRRHPRHAGGVRTPSGTPP
jgi:hypothetical protein